MFCRRCTYNLAGATGANLRCPECGQAFDPADSRTYLKGLAWRRARFWVCGTLILGVAYLVAPRGYVKGVAIVNTGGSAVQITQYRLAPPDWLWKVPYPRWTAESALRSPAQASVSGTQCDMRLDRVRWFNKPMTVASMSVASERMNLESARRNLTTQVRRQCRGYTGVWLSDDDSTMPEYMEQEREEW